MKIKVILLLYNRPRHTIKVLESLKKNNVNGILVFLDGAKNKKDISKQKKISRILKSYKEIISSIVIRNKNIGLALNMVKSIDYTFNKKADAIIVLEDDCVLKKNGFNFFKNSLNYFKDENDIKSICGYRIGNYRDIYKNNSPFILKRFFPWGWATWKEEWLDYHKTLKDIKSKKKHLGVYPKDIKVLFSKLKDKNFNKNIWSIVWIISHFLKKKYSLYPPFSVIENIGQDGSGINCDISELFSLNKYNKLKYPDVNFNKVYYNKIEEEILNNFMEKNYNLIYPSEI